MPTACCSCAADVPKSRLAYLAFHYNVPGEEDVEGGKEAAALVCPTCFEEAHDPLLYHVHEALINANLIRVEKPNLMFTPPEYLEWL